MPTGLIFARAIWPVIGGLEEHTHQLAKHLTEMGENITVMTHQRLDEPGDDEFDRNCGYPVVRMRTKMGMGGFLRDPWHRRLLVTGPVNVAREIGAEYIVRNGWTNSPRVNFSLTLAARMLGIPTFIFYHTLKPGLAGHTTLEKLSSKLALKAAAGFIGVSRAVAANIKGPSIDRAKVHFVYNGVDVRQPDSYLLRRGQSAFPRLDAALPSDAPTILTMSRLAAGKGIDRMIRVMPRILESVPDARYAIAGSGEDEDRIRRLVAESPARESITMLGPVTGDEKLECYARCAVYALPSDAEALSIVALEAAVFRKSVVGTRVGGIPEAVVHGETGLLVEPDDEEALANSLIRLLKNPDEARRMGENGRRRVETQFTWWHAADKFRDIVNATLNPQPPN